jgi:hypothetical protein
MKRKRPLTPLSLNMAMITTASVAAIRTPNTKAEGVGQPRSHVIPTVTRDAVTIVPKVERTRMGPSSTACEVMGSDAGLHADQAR